MKATTPSPHIPLLPKMKFHAGHFLLLLTLIAAALVFSGCASTESDNASVRPWNSPEGWQNGMLGDINQQHR